MTKLSIAKFGAKDNSNTDNTKAINLACEEAKNTSSSVVVPAGNFRYEGVLFVDSVEVIGEGDNSVLYALNVAQEAVFLLGRGAALKSIKLSGEIPPTRLTTWEAARVVARAGAQDWRIQNVTVERGSAAGLVSEGGVGGKIITCRVKDTLADGIHMTNKTSDVMIEDNVVDHPGDDGIACVSYQGNGGYCQKITARRNTIKNQEYGRGMSVVGGKNVLYEFNQISNTHHAAGIYIAQEDSWDTYGAHDVIVSRNSLYNCGGKTTDHTAILIFSNSFEKNSNIKLTRNLIVMDRENVGGIRDYSEDQNCVFESNVMMGCTPDYRITYPALFVVTPWTGGPVGVS
jgi:hypothetical protein